MGKLSSWLELLRALGQALGRLLQAEVAALSGDLKAAGRGLTQALVLFGICAFVVFWALGTLAYTLVEVAALWLPRWGAAASVLGLLLLVALVLGLAGRSRLRRLEPPATTVRRRLEEHREWWETRVGALDVGTDEAEGDAP